MTTTLPSPASWLKTYYLGRAAFAFAWLALALTVGAHSAPLAALLLVAYPAWDALANLLDAARSGGLADNRSQLINAVVSIGVALAIAFSLPSMRTVLAVFGAWAILAGLLQLGTALRRRAGGVARGQWAMILSGAQSALAGAFFMVQARGAAEPTIATVAGYAGFGGFYFLVSALLLVRAARQLRSN
jgi:uncharacterized membrane protein HdeD (DUF308 family)